MADRKKTVSETHASARPRHFLWLTLLAVLAILSIGKPLFSTEVVLSDRSADIASQFLYARAFGFGEMAGGNLALWNPYIYSGVPFLGDFQSALLYPPNLIFLLLPLATAINWSVAIHIFGLGAALYGWSVWRGLRPAAAFTAGACAMFGGSFFLHIYAGHLSNVCTMPWVPLIFWGIEGWITRRHAGWIFLAAAAAALQIYAGHVQYFYYTALVAGAYALVQVIGATRIVPALLGLAAIYPLAGLLAAAQLLPGLSAAGESVRSGGVDYAFSAMFSFPPENFLTLFAPWVFGDMRAVPYWGRCYLWEMSIFAGTGMLLLAVQGLLQPLERHGRTRLLVMLGLIVLLALGQHTPLHQLLYHVLPGFSSFRGSSKFIFFASVLFALCAGLGVDGLLRGRKSPVLLAACGAGLGLVLAICGFVFQGTAGKDLLVQFTRQVSATRESYLNPAIFEQETYMKAAQTMGAHALLIAGGCLVAFAVVLFLTRRWKPAVWLMVAGATLEIFLFARGTVTTFPLDDFTYRPVGEFFQKNPGDYRTLNLFNPDASMLLRQGNLWGYDPSVLKRYAQLLTLSQGGEPAQATQYLAFQRPHPILNFFRGQFAMAPKPSGEIDVTPIGQPLPRFLLVGKYEVLPDEQARYAALASPTFDFLSTAILEEEPIPQPDSLPGTFSVRPRDLSTDAFVVEVETSKPALLIITDSYSKDWQVEALPGSVQVTYRMLPANHAARAVPLAAGKHILRFEYRPAGLTAGALISLVTLCAVLGAVLVPRFRQRLSL